MRERVLSVTLKDCEVQHFRSGGKGGQNQNKRDTGTRIIHHASGARGESREERSQAQNTRNAFLRMVRTVDFQRWMALKLMEGPTPEQRVAQQMRPENIQTEVKQDGRWVVSDL